MNDRLRGFLLSAIAGVLWAITGVIGQFLFEQKGVVPTWLVSYRLLSAGSLLLIYLKCTKGEILEVWHDKSDAKLLVLYSVTGMMMVQFSFFKAVETSNAGTATVLQYLNPAMMLLFFAVTRGIRPALNESIAVCMALIGIFFVSTGGDVHNLTLSFEGLSWGLACAMFTCVYAILPIRLLRKYDPRAICGWGMLIGGIVLTAVVRPWTIDTTVDIAVIASMGFLVIFGTILPFCASLISIPLIGPINTNLLSSVEPIVAAIIAYFMLGTIFTLGEILGFVLIIGTIFILALSKDR